MKKNFYREFNKRRKRDLNNLNKRYKRKYLKIEFKEMIDFEGQIIYVFIIDGGREKGNANVYYNWNIVINNITIKNLIAIDKSLYDRISEKHYRFIIGHELGHIKIEKIDNIQRCKKNRRDFLTEFMCDLYSINKTNLNINNINLIQNELEDMKVFTPEFKRRFRIIRKILNKNLSFDSIYQDYKRYNRLCVELEKKEKELGMKRDKEISILNRRGKYNIPYMRSNRKRRIKEILNNKKEIGKND